MNATQEQDVIPISQLPSENNSDIIPINELPKEKPVVGGLVGKGLDIAFNKAPAGIREGLRAVSQDQEHNTPQDFGKGFQKGYNNPQDSESLQDEGNRNTQSFIDKLPFIGKLIKGLSGKEFNIPGLSETKNIPLVNKFNLDKINPQSPQSLVRGALGLPSSAAGVVADTATNPGQLATIAATDGLVKGMGNTKVGKLVGGVLKKPLEEIPADIANATKDVPDMMKAGTTDLSPENLNNKAQKLTTEVLQPPKGYMQNYFERGKTPPAIEQAPAAITKSKNYTQLRENIDEFIKKTFDERNGLLEQIDKANNNQPIGTDYIDRLDKFIKENKANGQSTPTEIKQMQDVLDREKDFYKNNPLSRVSGQARKEYLQNLTDSLLQKSEKGDVIDTQPARNLALNELRSGLRESVEGKYGKIKELNAKYGGLLDAKKFISGQEALSQKEVPPSIWERIPGISKMINPKEGIGEAITSAAARNDKSLATKTGKIHDLLKLILKRKTP